MNWFLNFAKSSIGAKFVMAITGFMMIGFVVAHMVGNLQIFAGQEVAEHAETGLIAAREALNAYGFKLQNDLKPLVWVLRLGLLGAFLGHMAGAYRVVTLNQKARARGYVVTRHQASTAMSRYMAWTGVVILVFVLVHLAHFTLGALSHDTYALTDPEGRHDVYNMVVLGFQNKAYAGFYIFAQALLGLHLGHGASSWLQTLGIFHKKYNPLIRSLGGVVGTIIFLGNISIPLAVLLGIVKASGV